MIALGVTYASLSGICNGLFTAPMKMIPRWKWENIWLVFIVTSCLLMPVLVVYATVPGFASVYAHAPRGAVAAALCFGFAWGFGAILFGLSVDRLGVAVSNSLVIGLSAALGSLGPLLAQRTFRIEPRQLILLLGVATFLAGIWMCGRAGRLRDAGISASLTPSPAGYLFAAGAGVMSAVFNTGYSLALPIADAGQQLGYSSFVATNCIWLLMLAAGSLPNMAFCGYLLAKNGSGKLFSAAPPQRTWAPAVLMGLLWGGSIYLYGAATPLLGDIGPSIGWPLSLAVALLVANLMGIRLGEWQKAPPAAVGHMRRGIIILLAAIVLCGLSTTM